MSFKLFFLKKINLIRIFIKKRKEREINRENHKFLSHTHTYVSMLYISIDTHSSSAHYLCHHNHYHHLLLSLNPPISSFIHTHTYITTVTIHHLHLRPPSPHATTSTLPLPTWIALKHNHMLRFVGFWFRVHFKVLIWGQFGVLIWGAK